MTGCGCQSYPDQALGRSSSRSRQAAEKVKVRQKENMKELQTWSITVWGRLSASMSRTKQSAPESSRLSRRHARTFLIRIDLEVKMIMVMIFKKKCCCETGHCEASAGKAILEAAAFGDSKISKSSLFLSSRSEACTAYHTLEHVCALIRFLHCTFQPCSSKRCQLCTVERATNTHT